MLGAAVSDACLAVSLIHSRAHLKASPGRLTRTLCKTSLTARPRREFRRWQRYDRDTHGNGFPAGSWHSGW